MNWPDRMDLWDAFEEVYLNDGEEAARAFYAERRRDMDAGAVVNWPQLQPLLWLMLERASSHDAFATEYGTLPDAQNRLLQTLVSARTASALTPATEGGKLMHQTLAEVVDFSRTRIILWGPGARQPEESMINALTRQSGSPATLPAMNNYGKIRLEYRDMAASVHADSRVLPQLGTEAMDVYCDATSGVHPAQHADGLPKFARYMALSLLNGWGVIPNLTPRITNSSFSAAVAEFWSSAGPITTPRIKRGLAAIPASFPHRTQVFGWEIDVSGTLTPAQSATIVAGRINVAPISGNFASGQLFAFGRGGGTGVIMDPADPIDRYDLNYPVVDFGHRGLDGLPVQAIPASNLMTMP